uniref:STRUCTURAL MAINTENANCE OF CHROMOSOMES PROTEIN n=1 Tax=Myoviridae sp. ctIty1 TaxID=2827673 RepID=A0A8S5TGH3_9CAUD|nr:MAG TPA: STRUCTURAL MAINTENANCE OF CHROMOSOMES PROTEIN [Myoviridae sp. ctIty1]
MRLLRLRLENYIGIYNGMGLSSIEIDFSKCIHKVLIIKGDNGTGKSTIFKALTPLADSSIDYIPDKTAIKEIAYETDFQTILNIKYESLVKDGIRRPTKCYLNRLNPDGSIENLNPSNNITTAKEVIYDILGIDDNFITLSQLSANKKGLGGLKPSERKRYVNSIISSLAAFNSIHKLITTKSTVLKSIIDSYVTKLSQIGNIAIVEDAIKKDTVVLQELDNKKNGLISEIATIKAELSRLDSSGNFLDDYKNLSMRKIILEKEIRDLPDIEEYSEEKLIQYEKDMAKYEANEEMLSSRAKELLDEESKINNNITELTIKLDSLYNKEHMDDLNSKIESTKKELESYKPYFHLFKTYKDISEQDYETVKLVIEKFNSTVENIFQTYSETVRKESMNSLRTGKKEVILDHTEILSGLEKQLEDLRTEKRDVEFLNNRSKDYNKIPNDCNHKSDCPFIKDVVEAKNALRSRQSLYSLSTKINSTLDAIESAKNLAEENMIKTQCLYEMKSILEYIQSMSKIIRKFPGTESLDSINTLYHNIEHGIRLNFESVDKYQEFKNISTIVSALEEDLHSYETAKEKLISANAEIRILQEKIDTNLKNLSTIRDSKLSIFAEIEKIRSSKMEIEMVLDSIRYAKINKAKFEEVSVELNEITNKIESMEKNTVLIKDLTDKLNRRASELSALQNTDLPAISKAIEENKYRMVLFEQYTRDSQEYAAKYNEVQMIKKYTSIHGIQTVYMSVFMNSILNTTNTLLRLLFGGRFALQPFIINENEFNIPCADSEGRVREDISLMSDSQLSMISMLISFVLLRNSSNRYNIIKLDEVDDNLDSMNRIQFSILIEQIMNDLGFDQCLIISHNNELDLSNTDIVILKMESQEMIDSLYNSGGNIVFSYNEYKR